MIEQSSPAADVIPFGDGTPDCPPENGVDALKQRVHRLEDAVAALQDTRALEDRLVERVAERVQQPAAAAEPASGVLATASRRLFPVFGMARRGDEAETPPAGIPILPLPPRSAWLAFDFITELRTILRMYLDRHYRQSWTARLVPIVALLCGVLSYFFLHGQLWILGDIIDKILDVVLILFAYKVLCREADRYRAARTPAGSMQSS